MDAPHSQLAPEEANNPIIVSGCWSSARVPRSRAHTSTAPPQSHLSRHQATGGGEEDAQL